MVFPRNDEAVSPVIGAILMVIVTVIIASVISAFMFGMAGNLSKEKVVAVSARRLTTTEIEITYIGGQDVGSISAFEFDGDITGTVTLEPHAGSIQTLTQADNNVKVSNTHVIVIGKFNDNTQQVLLNTFV